MGTDVDHTGVVTPRDAQAQIEHRAGLGQQLGGRTFLVGPGDLRPDGRRGVAAVPTGQVDVVVGDPVGPPTGPASQVCARPSMQRASAGRALRRCVPRSRAAQQRFHDSEGRRLAGAEARTVERSPVTGEWVAVDGPVDRHLEAPLVHGGQRARHDVSERQHSLPGVLARVVPGLSAEAHPAPAPDIGAVDVGPDGDDDPPPHGERPAGVDGLRGAPPTPRKGAGGHEGGGRTPAERLDPPADAPAERGPDPNQEEGDREQREDGQGSPPVDDPGPVLEGHLRRPGGDGHGTELEVRPLDGDGVTVHAPASWGHRCPSARARWAGRW